MRNRTGFASAFSLLTTLVIGALLSGGTSAASQEQPTIAKDSVQVTPFTLNVYKNNYDVWSWIPQIQYRVNGPIPSGGQLYVEFTLPTGPWVKFDCRTEETQKGYWWRTNCGGRDIPEEKGSTYTGPVNFAIRLRNELAGTDTTLFTGKTKVEKVLSNEHGPKAVNKFVYFVNHDWNLPVGYVFLTADELKGWDRPVLNVAFWVRGEAVRFEPHLFYQGKEVGKMFYEGQEVGKAGCDSEVENNTTHYVADSVPQKAKWARVRCTFTNSSCSGITGSQGLSSSPSPPAENSTTASARPTNSAATASSCRCRSSETKTGSGTKRLGRPKPSTATL